MLALRLSRESPVNVALAILLTWGCVARPTVVTTRGGEPLEGVLPIGHVEQAPVQLTCAGVAQTELQLLTAVTAGTKSLEIMLFSHESGNGDRCVGALDGSGQRLKWDLVAPQNAAEFGRPLAIVTNVEQTRIESLLVGGGDREWRRGVYFYRGDTYRLRSEFLLPPNRGWSDVGGATTQATISRYDDDGDGVRDVIFASVWASSCVRVSILSGRTGGLIRAYDVDCGSLTDADIQLISFPNAHSSPLEGVLVLTHQSGANVFGLTRSGVEFRWAHPGGNRWTDSTLYGLGTSGTAVSDVTGDGRFDFVLLSSSEIYVFDGASGALLRRFGNDLGLYFIFSIKANNADSKTPIFAGLAHDGRAGRLVLAVLSADGTLLAKQDFPLQSAFLRGASLIFDGSNADSIVGLGSPSSEPHSIPLEGLLLTRIRLEPTWSLGRSL